MHTTHHIFLFILFENRFVAGSVRENIERPRTERFEWLLSWLAFSIAIGDVPFRAVIPSDAR